MTCGEFESTLLVFFDGLSGMVGYSFGYKQLQNTS
jgi:hypothetical protein